MSGKKRKCHFNNELQKEYPFLKKRDHNPHVAFCSQCSSEINIAHGGISDIKLHLKTKKHLAGVSAVAMSTSMSKFITKNDSDKHEIVAKEAVLAYHTVKHNHSFRSLDCTSKLISALFEKKFSSARTKSEAMVKNVLAPDTQKELMQELSETSCFTLMIDSSNHGAQKLVPIVVRYFHERSGVNVKVLELDTLPGETSDQLNDYVLSVLNRNDLVEKLVGISADNTNTNFGGAKRKGKNNLFCKLSANTDKTLVGIGCMAHVVNNCINNAADLLPVDAEVIIVKLFKFFHIYTVRVAELKELCEFIDMEYRNLLSYSNTRWLRLQPALERVLQMFEPLKNYFSSQSNPPAVLKSFFEDPDGELWLWFLHNVSSMFNEVVKKMEGDKISATYAANEYLILHKNLVDRKSSCFLPVKVKEIQRKNALAGNGCDLQDLKDTVCSFYDHCITYLELWKSNIDSLSQLSWIDLKKTLKWEDLEESSATFQKSMPPFSIDDVFNELSVLNSLLSDDILAEWARQKITTEQRWLAVFRDLEAKDIKIPNLKVVVEFVLSLPGTNASVERAFSLINNFWGSEKSAMSKECVKAMLIIQMNCHLSCTEMYDKIKKNKSLLKSLASTEKYDWSKNSQPSCSTSEEQGQNEDSS
jgi:hypothetical protein